jgi:hypothetical protein
LSWCIYRVHGMRLIGPPDRTSFLPLLQIGGNPGKTALDRFKT